MNDTVFKCSGSLRSICESRADFSPELKIATVIILSNSVPFRLGRDPSLSLSPRHAEPVVRYAVEHGWVGGGGI